MKELFLKTIEGDITFTAGGYLSSGFIMLALLVGAVLLTRHSDTAKKFSAKQLAICSMSVALAMVTSMIPIYSFPFGGSVTLFSMFFICFIGYLYGFSAGIFTGFAYGILQLIVKPYIYFPIQVLIDYPLAFGALGLSGFFSKSKNGLIKGYLLGISGRYFFAVLSGCLFFGEYAWEGWAVLPYSLVYNGAYIFTEGAITILLVTVVAPLKNGLGYVKKLTAE